MLEKNDLIDEHETWKRAISKIETYQKRERMDLEQSLEWLEQQRKQEGRRVD